MLIVIMSQQQERQSENKDTKWTSNLYKWVVYISVLHDSEETKIII